MTRLGIPGLKTPLAGFIAGVALLTMGRRLFWFFVGVAGFIFGFDIVRLLLPREPHKEVLIIALVIGLICALMAVALQKIAIAAGGFLAGGYLLTRILNAFGMAAHQPYWVLFIAGGIIGAFLMVLAFGFALIVLSSLLGADLVLQALGLGGKVFTVLFVLLSVLGFAFQYGLIRPKPLRGKKQN